MKSETQADEKTQRIVGNSVLAVAIIFLITLMVAMGIDLFDDSFIQNHQ